MIRAIACAAVFSLLLPAAGLTAVIRIPGEIPTIQQGINAAVDGDTVLVADGTYTGEGNRDLFFHGKAITVCSENGPELCIIDIQGSAEEEHRGFWFHQGEGPDSILDGFTIRNGYSTFRGSAITCSASPTIRNNIVIGNTVLTDGGAIYCWYSSPVIEGNVIENTVGSAGIVCATEGFAVIRDNLVRDNEHVGIRCRNVRDGGEISSNIISGNGSSGISLHSSNTPIHNNLIVGNGFGGIYCQSFSDPLISNTVVNGNSSTTWGSGIICRTYCPATIVNCLITGNHTAQYGGGLCLFSNSHVTVTGCTIAGNTAGQQGGGLYGRRSDLTIRDTIFWGDSAPVGDEIYIGSYSSSGTVLDISFSNVEGGDEFVFVDPYSTLHWGEGMISEDPLFAVGPEGEHYLSQTDAGQDQESPCVDGGDPESTILAGTTRTDHIQDMVSVDIGYHYPLSNTDPGIVAGAGPSYGNPPRVRVFPPEQDATFSAEFDAYGIAHYGVKVAAADVDGDQRDEIITGAGPGNVFGPHVRGFQGDGTPIDGLSFLAYGTNKYGVNVASGDLNHNGRTEIVTGAGPGAVFGPHVRAFRYDPLVQTVAPVPGVSFFAYGTHKYGVNVTAGDVDGDGYDEIVTGAGPGAVFGPHVRGWNVDGGAAEAIPDLSFLAYGTNRYGVVVSCGDVDGDGIDEIVTAPGPSSSFAAHIRGWNVDGSSVQQLPGFSFLAWSSSITRFGATVFAGTDLNGDSRDELIVGAGPDPAVGALISVYRYNGAAPDLLLTLEGFPDHSDWTYGANVAAGRY